MNEQHDKSQRNLAILSYMGLACQFVGFVGAFGSMAGFWGSKGTVTWGFMMLVFGMALGGWAGNLSQIIDLKKRLSAMEVLLSKETDKQA
jgi:hypothetical protein